jgi:TetR/AcrR family transcriptional repressor of mexJK operon
VQPTAANEGSEGTGREARKKAAILDAAREVFLGNGYVGASMDQVAATAAVSKQTVYKHFGDKEALFRAVVTNVIRARDDGITAELLSMGDGSFEEGLRSFARYFLRGVMQPDVLKLRRLVIGEAGRFPELGRTFYDLGPKRAATQLSLALREADTQDELTLDDSYLAAEHLLSLVLSIPLDQAMLLGDGAPLTESALDRYAEEGVSAFLRSYRAVRD